MPTVSIILPCYNGSKYIRESIDSCLAQTYEDFELIIVNDCSTDDTPTIVHGYMEMDPRVKLLNNEKNLRLPLSLNKGFENAKGKYFTWTSDDNLYAPNALNILVSLLNNHNDVDLVYTDYTLIDNTGKVTGTKVFGDINVSFNNWLGCGACFLYRREVHETLRGYNPSFFLIEDYEFFVRAFTKFRFKYLPLTDTYFYREHDASLTAANSNSINDISKIAIEKQIPQLVKVLPTTEIALLYRKFSVFFAVQKNNSVKYGDYLSKLYAVSPKQAIITVIYIIVMKFYHSFVVSFKTITTLLKNMLKMGQR